MTAKDALAGTTNTNVVAGVKDGKRATKFIVFEELAKGIEKVEQWRGHQSDAHKTSDSRLHHCPCTSPRPPGGRDPGLGMSRVNANQSVVAWYLPGGQPHTVGLPISAMHMRATRTVHLFCFSTPHLANGCITRHYVAFIAMLTSKPHTKPPTFLCGEQPDQATQTLSSSL